MGDLDSGEKGKKNKKSAGTTGVLVRQQPGLKTDWKKSYGLKTEPGDGIGPTLKP